MVSYLEQLAGQLKKDSYMQAKLHGFKVRAPIEQIRWTKKETSEFEKMGQDRYEELLKSE